MSTALCAIFAHNRRDSRGRTVPLTPLSDWTAVGARVALARRTLELTQAHLAAAIGIDRSALAKIELGSRNLSALELAALARETGLPIDWFVAESQPVVASRRKVDFHDSTIVDIRIEVLAREVTQLIEMDLLRPAPLALELSVPHNVEEAETAAGEVRARLGRETDEVIDLAAAADALGVFAYSLELGDGNADGAYVSIDGGVGVALVNGSQPSARRRFTLAHEIGHHVFQDAYAVDIEATGRSETERMIDAFAIHLLLPREALERRWSRLGGGDDARSAAIVIAAEYRLSWTALCGHLVNTELLGRDVADVMRAALPRGGEYAEMGVNIVEELVPPMAPRPVVQAALRGYRRNLLGTGRTLELVRWTLTETDLRDRDEIPLAALAGELRGP